MLWRSLKVNRMLQDLISTKHKPVFFLWLYCLTLNQLCLLILHCKYKNAVSVPPGTFLGLNVVANWGINCQDKCIMNSRNTPDIWLNEAFMAFIRIKLCFYGEHYMDLLLNMQRFLLSVLCSYNFKDWCWCLFKLGFWCFLYKCMTF